MRTTNLAYKRRFPLEHATRRAEGHRREHGVAHVVLGHFHQEMRLQAEGVEILVLPDWKRSRRHLEWDPVARAMTFADSLG
jgi:UDP-2,3-diacylglucosamine pyrophosphatase LpxH